MILILLAKCLHKLSPKQKDTLALALLKHRRIKSLDFLLKEGATLWTQELSQEAHWTLLKQSVACNIPKGAKALLEQSVYNDLAKLSSLAKMNFFSKVLELLESKESEIQAQREKSAPSSLEGSYGAKNPSVTFSEQEEKVVPKENHPKP